MKIGLVCPYNMFEHAGGVQEVVVNLAKGLRKRGHEVKIITPKPAGFKGELPEHYILLGVSRRLNGTLSTILDVGIEVDGDEIDRVLERENFDVINFHEPWYPVLSRQIAMRSKTTALVGTFHATLPDSMTAKSVVNLLKPYGKSITERMHLLTATGPAAASVLLSKGTNSGVNPKLLQNLKYIPVAIDLKYFKPTKKKVSLNGPRTKTIVYVGRPDKRKGLDWLIKAFGLLQNQMPAAHLVVAGDGDRMKTIKQQVKSAHIQNVEFKGYVTDEEKLHLLQNADLACFPSLYGEGFGIVLLEAMATGTPLLAGNNIGYRTVMQGTGRVSLIDPEASDDFANRMAVMLEDDGLRQLISHWGLNTVRQYNYPKIISQYESAYEEAIDLFEQITHISKESAHNASKRPKALRWFGVRRQS